MGCSLCTVSAEGRHHPHCWAGQTQGETSGQEGRAQQVGLGEDGGGKEPRENEGEAGDPERRIQQVRQEDGAGRSPGKMRVRLVTPGGW